MHNLHHADPTCARHGVSRGQLDLSALLIAALERAGWAQAVDATGSLGAFALCPRQRSTVSAGALLRATGVTDVPVDVPGLAEHWGTGVSHRSFCHGYETCGKTLAVLATGSTPCWPPTSPTASPTMSSCAPTGRAELPEFVAGALEAPSVRIVESPVTAVEGQAGVFAAGDAAHLEAVPEPTTLVSVAAAAGVAAAVWMEQDLFRAGLPVASPS